MEDKQQKLSRDMIVMGVLSGVLHQTGIFLVFFAVPIQFLAVRRSWQGFLNGSMISLGVIALWKGFQILQLDAAQADSMLVMLDLLVPLAVIAGLAVLNYRHLQIHSLWLIISLGGLAAMMLVIPFVLYAPRSPVFLALVELQHVFFTEQGLLVGVSLDELTSQMLLLLFRGIGGVMTALVALNYFFGNAAAGKNSRLQDLSIPRYLPLWAVAAVALLFFGAAGLFDIIAYNVLLVILLLHVLAGVSLVNLLLARRLPARQSRFLVTAVLFMVLFVPLVNIAVFVLLPVAGVLDTIFRLRERILNKE